MNDGDDRILGSQWEPMCMALLILEILSQLHQILIMWSKYGENGCDNTAFCHCNFRFSHNRGSCFVSRTVDTTGVFQLSRGLLFDPSAASLLGFVMGVEGTGEDDEWRVITLDFLSLLKRPC